MTSTASALRNFKLHAVVFALLISAGGVALRAQAAPSPQPHAAAAGDNSASPIAAPAKNPDLEDENEKYRHSPAVRTMGSWIGLNPDQAATAFTIFNLLVLFGGIGYLVAKNLPKAFRKRNTDIQKHLVDARTATEEATARLSSVEARLSKLDDQIAAMRTQAEADSARDEQRIKASVEEEKKKILAAAEAEIQAATALARREIQSYAADLAIDQAARKLVVTAETDRLLVESFAHRLMADIGSEN
jgi:F-type H+-transporting ATPase subunit b